MTISPMGIGAALPKSAPAQATAPRSTAPGATDVDRGKALYNSILQDFSGGLSGLEQASFADKANGTHTLIDAADNFADNVLPGLLSTTLSEISERERKIKRMINSGNVSMEEIGNEMALLQLFRKLYLEMEDIRQILKYILAGIEPPASLIARLGSNSLMTAGLKAMLKQLMEQIKEEKEIKDETVRIGRSAPAPETSAAQLERDRIAMTTGKKATALASTSPGVPAGMVAQAVRAYSSGRSSAR